jgi:hypothetical protein
MGLKDWALKQQVKAMTRLPDEFRKTMRRNLAEFEKQHGRKPTKDELLSPILSQGMLVSSAAIAGITIKDIEMIGEEVLND